MNDTIAEVENDDAERLSVLSGVRRGINVLATIAVFVALYFAKDLVLPILLGFLLALTFSPVTRYLKSFGLPYAASAVLLIGLTGAGAATIGLLSAGTINSWASEAPSIGRELKVKLADVFKTIDGVKDASNQVEEITTSTNDDSVQEVVIRQPSLLDSAVSTLTGAVTTASVAMILAIFLLSSGDMFYLKLVQSFDLMSHKKRALTAVYDIERNVSRYLLTITLINAGLGVAVGASLWALGLEYAYIWGTAAFLLNFLPYIGSLFGVGMVAVYAIVFFDSFYYALLAPATYLLLTTLEGQFITPLLVGRRLEINSVSVFLTVVIWGWLWGIPGALVAVPSLVVFKVICDNTEGLGAISNFLSSAEVRAVPASSDAKPTADAA